MKTPLCLALLFAPLVASAEEVPAEIAAWNAFCDSLKESGGEILAQYPQPHEIDRAEAPLFLAQQLRVAIRQTLAARDASFPYAWTRPSPHRR